MISRREKIQEYIRNHSEKIITSGNIDDNGIDAEGISFDLKIDRANVSRELNQLWKSGYLIKIAGRPVFYLDSETVANAFPDAYVPSFIPKENCLSDYVNSVNTYKSPYDSRLDLSNMIGAGGSLSSVIEKAIAAISYPPYGLHTLITGNSGTEKSTLADSMVEYAIRNNIRSKKCPYYDIDCRRANADVSQFERKLFGYQDEYDRSRSSKGILEMCTNGFLLLQNIDYLPQSTADLLLSLLNKGYFTRINSNFQIPVKFMMILISALPLSDEKLLPYTHYITTNIALPDIDERGIYEKLIMIMDCFAREARNIRKPLLVSRDAIACYGYKIYTENITKMENEIRDACSRAYAAGTNGSAPISVNIAHLPKEVLDPEKINAQAVSELPQYFRFLNEDGILYDTNGHSDEFDRFRSHSNRSIRVLKDIIGQSLDNGKAVNEKTVEEIIDSVRKRNPSSLQEIVSHVSTAIKVIVDNVLFNDPDFLPLQQDPQLLYGLYLQLSEYLKEPKKYETELPENSYPHERELSAKITEKIRRQLNVTVDENETDFITLYLAYLSKHLGQRRTAILVCAHGRHVASEMSEYVIRNSGSDIPIAALNLEDDSDFSAFMKKAIEKAVEINEGPGIVVLADRAPLTSLAEYIENETGIRCASVSPLSLDKLFEAACNGRYNVYDRSEENDDPDTDSEYLCSRITENLQDTVRFIDVPKAIAILKQCLMTTLSKLDLNYNRQIGIIYYENGIRMLERVIKNEPLQNRKLYKYISENHELIAAFSQGLEHANKAYRIRIPQSEIAGMVSSLFPYLKQPQSSSFSVRK